MGTIDRDFATISVLPSPGAFMKVEQRAADSKAKEAVTDKAALLKLYREMLLIRRFEEKTAEMYQAAKIGGFCHLNIGEEATIVGTISALRPTDYVYSTYREHGHAIAKGLDPKAVMAELFGKETGTSHGRGGAMHLLRQEHPLYGRRHPLVPDPPATCAGGSSQKEQPTGQVVMS